MRLIQASKPVLLFLIIMGMTACGGGGDGDTGGNSNTPEPAVWNNSTWDNMTWQ